jgi:steroid delta-isomerase-like uncharacterized protein
LRWPISDSPPFDREARMTRDDVLAVLARRQDAIARRDWERFGALYSPNACLESPLAGCVHGSAAIARATESFLAAFSDAVVVEEPPIVEGHRAAIVADVTGTHVGAIMGLPPSGRAFRFRAAFVFVIEDGCISHERRIYDFTGLLVQIGVLKAKPA